MKLSLSIIRPGGRRTPEQQRRWGTFPVLAAFLVVALAAPSLGQTTSIVLHGGDSQSITCDGDNLTWNQTSALQGTVSCLGTTTTTTAPSTSTTVPTGSTVYPTVETDAFSGSGDIADDPAIWVHPTDPAKSLVIGSDKDSSGGVGVFNLAGKMVQFIAGGKINNVDLRGGFPLGGTNVTLVGASERKGDTVLFWKVNPATQRLEPVAKANTIKTPFDPYGFTFYRSPVSGKFYMFVSADGSGGIQQYELDGSSGAVRATLVRTISGLTTVEGMAADDTYAHLYASEEDKGLWRYGAEPGAGTSRGTVGLVGDGNLSADVEGVAIAYGADGGGYVIVSSQGSSTFVAYNRKTGALVRKFKVGASGTIDASSSTDGIDVTTAGLGPAFPSGMLAIHDASNSGGNTSNFKFVPLERALGGIPTTTTTTAPSSTTPTTAPPPTTTTTVPAPTTTTTVPASSGSGLWISRSELMALPTSGAAWNAVLSAANSSWGTANLADNNSNHDVKVLAGAYVATRTNDATMRAKVIAGIKTLTSSGYNRVLEMSRNITSYVIAADVIDLKTVDPATNSWFRGFIAGLRTKALEGHSGGTNLRTTAMFSTNNWGGRARAAMSAIDVYLGDLADVADIVVAQRGYVGEDVNHQLKFTSTNWHANSSDKAGINRPGATIQGRDVDGVIPEDQRRTGEFAWPAPAGYYPWGGLQGEAVSMAILHRAGLLSFAAGDAALARAADWLFNVNNNPPDDSDGNATTPWIINKYAGTSLPVMSPTTPGKNIGWTDWTHR